MEERKSGANGREGQKQHAQRCLQREQGHRLVSFPE